MARKKNKHCNFRLYQVQFPSTEAIEFGVRGVFAYSEAFYELRAL